MPHPLPFPDGRRRRRLRFLFLLLAIGFSIVLGEGAAFLWMHAHNAEFRLEKLHELQRDIARGAAVSDGASETVHPYLGMVNDPDLTSPVQILGKSVPTNRYGLQYQNDGIFRRSPDQFIVGITGGSVAWQFLIAGEEQLALELARHPVLQGRKITFACLACSGYKQPQQLLAYQYFRTLGAEYDVLINIDGYNETALAIMENAMAGTAVSYPRSWHTRALTIADPAHSEDAYQLLTLRAQRQSLARSHLRSAWKSSYLANLWWRARDAHFQNSLLNLGRKVMHQEKIAFQRSGPGNQYQDPFQNLTAAVEIWSNASRQLHESCTASNTIYLHMLQPNIWVTDSKPVSVDEQQLLRESSFVNRERGEYLRIAYPKLVQAGTALQSEGIRFSDQTKLFSDSSHSTYSDACCHLNQTGNELLARKIAETLISMLLESASN